MTPDDFKIQAAASYASLRDQTAMLRANFEGVRWRTPADVEALIETNLKLVENTSLPPLDQSGSSTLRVLSGEKDAAWWQAQADTLRATLTDTARNLGQSLPSWQRITDEIVRPTIVDAVADAGAATQAISSITPLWVKVAIGLGVAAAAAMAVAVVASYLPKGKT